MSLNNNTFPPLYHVKQTLPAAEPIDVEAALESEWQRLNMADHVRGKRIALGFGSRGVVQIDRIARKIVALMKESGSDPFIVPAMGSHGGAIAEGQIEVLSGLGITEESVGCPINATMDVVDMGVTASGLPALLDRNVAEADGVILTNRVKIHTDFHGPHESGIIKMLAIGLGKEKGASRIHSFGTKGLREYMPITARHLIDKLPFVAGFGLVEDGYHRPARLEGFIGTDMVAGDQRLLDLSRSLMPSIPVDELDVLVLDEMGPNISGAGMDTNVIGRWMIAGEPEPERPRIKNIVVLDLTPESHGNAAAAGLADFMPRRLLDKIDFPVTTKNVFTSGFLLRGKLPMVFENDYEAIDAAVTDLFRARPEDRENLRMIRIKNTMELEDLWVSPALVDELSQMEGVTVDNDPAPLTFTDGHLF